MQFVDLHCLFATSPNYMYTNIKYWFKAFAHTIVSTSFVPGVSLQRRDRFTTLQAVKTALTRLAFNAAIGKVTKSPDFIARSHCEGRHALRHFCPSVCHTHVLSKNETTCIFDVKRLTQSRARGTNFRHFLEVT